MKMKPIQIDPDGAVVFGFDLTEYLGSDGALTPEGRGKLRLQLVAKLTECYPDLGQSDLAQMADAIIDRTPMPGTPASVLLSATMGVLSRISNELDAIPDRLMDCARTLRNGGPHVFGLGKANATIEVAIGLLGVAQEQIKSIAGCKACNEDADKPSPHAN